MPFPDGMNLPSFFIVETPAMRLGQTGMHRCQRHLPGSRYKHEATCKARRECEYWSGLREHKSTEKPVAYTDLKRTASAYQLQPLKYAPVFFLCGDEIDPCRGDVAVTQNVRQLHHVLCGPVECPREQMPQIMWKDFSRVHMRLFTDGFHVRPDLLPG